VFKCLNIQDVCLNFLKHTTHVLFLSSWNSSCKFSLSSLDSSIVSSVEFALEPSVRIFSIFFFLHGFIISRIFTWTISANYLRIQPFYLKFFTFLTILIQKALVHLKKTDQEPELELSKRKQINLIKKFTGSASYIIKYFIKRT